MNQLTYEKQYGFPQTLPKISHCSEEPIENLSLYLSKFISTALKKKLLPFSGIVYSSFVSSSTYTIFFLSTLLHSYPRKKILSSRILPCQKVPIHWFQNIYQSFKIIFYLTAHVCSSSNWRIFTSSFFWIPIQKYSLWWCQTNCEWETISI